MPLGKIRNFGGKLGLELQAMGCSTAGQARRTTHHCRVLMWLSGTASLGCISGAHTWRTTVRRRCEQVVALSDAVLLARFGERARFIAASVRGISDEPVQVRTP